MRLAFLLSVMFLWGRKDKYDKPDPVTCPTCGGNRSIQVPRRGRGGKTEYETRTCTTCGGSGKVFQ